MISAAIGVDAAAARLDAMPAALAANFEAEVERLAGVLRERIGRKLSGEVLQRRSGRLAGSITAAVERSGFAVSATVSSDAPYAAIHEYGGRLPPREILPQGGCALTFPWRGQQRFFKRVSLPSVTLPERSFMRSALAEIEPEIRAAIVAAAKQAMTS